MQGGTDGTGQRDEFDSGGSVWVYEADWVVADWWILLEAKVYRRRLIRQGILYCWRSAANMAPDDVTSANAYITVKGIVSGYAP